MMVELMGRVFPVVAAVLSFIAVVAVLCRDQSHWCWTRNLPGAGGFWARNSPLLGLARSARTPLNSRTNKRPTVALPPDASLDLVACDSAYFFRFT
jgi:hypothetical protein